jgi:hypothetical protein
MKTTLTAILLFAIMLFLFDLSLDALIFELDKYESMRPEQ